MPLDASPSQQVALIDHLKKQGDKLFARDNLLSYWEELRRNFYPERESFTGQVTLGEEFAEDLMTSFPLVARRDLGNTFSAMLRNSAKPWYKMKTSQPQNEDTLAKQYLEGSTELMRNAMYDTDASFVRACREADHDYVTFGQACIQLEMHRPRNGNTPHLLYRCRHLRDVAWCEGVTGKIDTIYRRDKLTAIDINRLWPHRIHQQVKEKLKETPYDTVNVWHVVLPADMYEMMPGGRKMRQPWVSIYIDVDNKVELECVGQWTRGYVIPRWQTVSGSQYAHSAALVAALPDARLLQAVTLVLLEVGEKAANPPVIATENVVRSDIALYAGGRTWVSEEYDEKMGEALRPITQDKTGLTFALELVRDIRLGLRDAMFLNKLDMPPVGGPEMTAYEVGQRIQEYVRNCLPLFEPVETDYSAWLCEDSFELLYRNSPEMQMMLPPSLRGADRTFEFESPLKAAAEKAKAGQFIEAGQIIAAAAQRDPNAILLMDDMKATREVLGAVVPAKWMRGEDEINRTIANQRAKQEQERMLALMAEGAKTVKLGSEAAVNLSTAMPNFQLQ